MAFRSGFCARAPIYDVQAWPAPIPLFLFALVVGWLAYRTQSLVPGIVLHMLFNLVASLVLLYSQVFQAAA